MDSIIFYPASKVINKTPPCNRHQVLSSTSSPIWSLLSSLLLYFSFYFFSFSFLKVSREFFHCWFTPQLPTWYEPGRSQEHHLDLPHMWQAQGLEQSSSTAFPGTLASSWNSNWHSGYRMRLTWNAATLASPGLNFSHELFSISQPTPRAHSSIHLHGQNDLFKSQLDVILLKNSFLRWILQLRCSHPIPVILGSILGSDSPVSC